MKSSHAVIASSRPLLSMCGAALLCCAAITCPAQPYPQKPIRVVVPFVPGGTVDTTARIITAKMAEGLGQPLVIDYRSGANGIVGADHVAKATPDGYTLLAAPSGQAINHLLNKNVTYDPVKDFAPVILIGTVPMLVVVHPSMPTPTIKALISLAKAQPGALTYGSGGAGSSSHLAVELFSTLAGVKLTHVPYKGDAPRIIDLLGGHIALLFLNSPGALPLVKANRVRALAVTSARRTEQMPDVPALAETVPGYEAGSWQGWFAPAGVPPEIIMRLNTEAARVLRMPEVRERLAGLGMNVIGDTPEAFAAFFKADIAKWADVIKRSNVKL